jgi:hypothetical protein
MGILTLAGTIIPSILKIIDKVIPDKALAAKTKLKIIELQHQGKIKELDLLGKQLEVNKEEAKSNSLFKSGWRPFIGWSCAIYIVIIAIVLPAIAFILAPFGVEVTVPMTDPLITGIITGMLGIGYIGARSYDKFIQKQTINEKKLFDFLRQKFGRLTQKEVELVLETLKELRK